MDRGRGGGAGQSRGVYRGDIPASPAVEMDPIVTATRCLKAVGNCLWGGEGQVVVRVVGDDPHDCRQRQWGTIFSIKSGHTCRADIA
jgi:hypothetical protein